VEFTEFNEKAESNHPFDKKILSQGGVGKRTSTPQNISVLIFLYTDPFKLHHGVAHAAAA